MAKKNEPKSKESAAMTPPPGTSLETLVRSSSLIFSGTVVERGNSTVPAVPPNENLVVVRVDRGLRVDPVLGDLQGKLITVAAPAPEALSVGQKAVFFTNSWIHGGGVAVREVEHWDVREEEGVAAAVAQLPQIHLLERLESAELVVDAEVVSISTVERTSFDRKAALWAAAELRIRKVLRGQGRASTVLYFPTAEWPPWTKAPRFQEGQRGIFILHKPSRNTSSEAALEAGSLVALDAADFQPESQLVQVERLLTGIQ